MVEAGAEFISEAVMVDALEYGHEQIRNIIALIEKMAEGLVDSLCFQSGADLPESSSSSESNHQDRMSQSYHGLVESEILEFLSYLKPPSDEEMEQIWTWRLCDAPGSSVTPPKRRPRRHTLRQRAERVHRLKHERGMQLSPVSVLHRNARSMDVECDLYQSSNNFGTTF